MKLSLLRRTNSLRSRPEIASKLLDLLNVSTQWQTRDNAGELSSNQIAVWRVHLDRESECVRSLAETLSSDEKHRAARFHFEQDCKRFIVARGTLRKVLSGYLGMDPSSVQFRYGRRGKPALDEKYQSDISFNVTHSQDTALLAIQRQGNIGVDIEKIRNDFRVEDIARRFFSESELHELLALPEAQRAEAFFLCWTRKEALIKALGEGLHIPLNSFGVSLNPNDAATFTHGVSRPWEIESFTAGNGYPAAVVYEGRRRPLVFFEHGFVAF
jgi:4'-phosphopantetheinyl transferase